MHSSILEFIVWSRDVKMWVRTWNVQTETLLKLKRLAEKFIEAQTEKIFKPETILKLE